MAKRFTSTEIWGEDWFLDMPNEYKLFWYYLLSSCDHSGLFRVNLRSFCSLLNVDINSEQALKYFNNGKDRILEVSKTVWLVQDFFVYQYGNKFNINNRVHASIKKSYERYNIKLTSIRGLNEYNDTLKDKDKEKDKEEEKEEAPIVSIKSDVEKGFVWGTEVMRFLNDSRWRENFCMARGIKDKDLYKSMKEFTTKLTLQEDFKDCGGLKKHYVNHFNKYGLTVAQIDLKSETAQPKINI